MTYSLLLFDDGVAASWEPFTLTRPVGELLFGTLLMRERAERYWSAPCLGEVAAPALMGFSETGAPPLVDPGDISEEEHRIFQTSRVALAGDPPSLPPEPANLVLDDEVVGWVLPPDAPNPTRNELLEPAEVGGYVSVKVRGSLLSAPWELMTLNGKQLREDIPRFFPGYAADRIEGCHIVGDGLLSLGTDVTVEPGSVFDVRSGSIRLSDGVVVRSHTRLQGPAYVGPGSTILGGSLSEVSIGPVSKVRGEVESSVILGYSNKAHDGFIGHAYLGRWVNLGAFTTNSDLKNNYGPVRVPNVSGFRETGLMKVGCFLGDHVKTGIGTLLNTGTVVGAGSNLYGGRMPPTYVPPFSWGSGEELAEFRLDKFLEVAARAMGRRGVEISDDLEGMFRRAWEATRGLRGSGPRS